MYKFLQYRVESIQEHEHMLWLEDQSWSETDTGRSNAVGLKTCVIYNHELLIQCYMINSQILCDDAASKGKFRSQCHNRLVVFCTCI